MAETLVSPGVLARENDQSFITQQPVQVGAALVGPTVKGPVEQPIIVTSYSDYQNRFGTTFESGSEVFTYFTSISAYNYFNNGGNTLLVTRVVSGSTAAWGYASANVLAASASATAVTFEAIDKGALWNNSGGVTSGSLDNGTIDNVRWQVVSSNTASGTFSLVVRRGDDSNNNPIVLESWTNMSLDPTQPNFVSRVIGDNTFNYNATENYLEVSGSYPNRSRFIRVKEVNLLTPNYLNNAGNAKDTYTGSIPVLGSGSANGSFTGGTGSNLPGIGTYTAGGNYYFKAGTASGAAPGVTQGLVGSDYDNMLDLLANQDDYAFNVLLTPGLFNSAHASQTTTAINNTQNRGDSIYVLDPIVYGSTIAATNTQAASRNTSYAAMYWPWLQTIDPDSGQNVWVPASTMLGGVYAYNDSVSEPWFAPAGINRGGLGNVIRPERKLTQSNRDSLYTNNVNPIASFPGVGTVVYGQKTLQRQASALDRVNVRRLLIALKGYISQVSQTLLFEQNTAATRNNFLAAVNPYLESVQQRQGLYAFKVVMDDSNNTPDVIDRNQLVGAIYLQPTKTAEFIILDFNVLPTGATFPS
jgi:uncharacterized protein